MTTRISPLWTRLVGLPSKMKIHKILHINILLFKATMAYLMHHARPFSVMTRSSGVQVQVWRRLGLLSTMKTHNFFHIHLLLHYRVTEADATSHSWPPQVVTHSSRFRTISRRCVMIIRSNFTQGAQKIRHESVFAEDSASGIHDLPLVDNAVRSKSKCMTYFWTQWVWRAQRNHLLSMQ